jgi:hypothetical protein
VPGVKNANGACGAPAIWPRETSSMQCGVKYHTILGRPGRANYHRCCRRSKTDVPAIRGKYGSQVPVYRTSAANIGNDHPFLHSPGVVAIHEPPDRSITVVLAYRVAIVNRFTFGEQAVVRRQNREGFALQEE